jgi:aarF domain-containing kinase
MLCGVGTYALLENLDEPPLTYVAVSHFVRSFLTLGFIIVDYKFSGDPIHEIHQRNAERVLKMCLANRGLWIKIGQHISALENIIPYEYTNTMKACQDNVTAISFERIKAQIEKETGRTLKDLYIEFDAKPCASASIGQVHRAYLHSGQKVAVKVQYPRLSETLNREVYLLDVLISVTEWFFPAISLKWLVREFKINLPIELDFLNEGKNAETLARHFSSRNDVTTPKIYWNLTTKKVITMEFIDGVKITRENLELMHISPQQVSDILMEVYAQQIFVNGFVHVDPHVGNIFVRRRNNWKGFELVFLDHGLYKTLSNEFMTDYSKLWKSIIFQEMDEITRLSKKIGVDSPELLSIMLTYKEIGKQTEDVHVDEMMAFGQANFIDILRVLSQVPSEMVLIFKANELLRGIQMSYSLSMTESHQIFAKYALRNWISDVDSLLERAWWKFYIKLYLYFRYLRSIFY